MPLDRTRSEADILLESIPYLSFPSAKFKKLFTMTVTNICQDLTDASYEPRNGSEEINENNPVAVFTQPAIDMLRSHIEDIETLSDVEVIEDKDIQPDLVDELEIEVIEAEVIEIDDDDDDVNSDLTMPEEDTSEQ